MRDDAAQWLITEQSDQIVEYALKLGTMNKGDDGPAAVAHITLACCAAAASLAASMIHLRMKTLGAQIAGPDIERIVADFRASIEQDLTLMQELSDATQGADHVD